TTHFERTIAHLREPGVRGGTAVWGESRHSVIFFPCRQRRPPRGGAAAGFGCGGAGRPAEKKGQSSFWRFKKMNAPFAWLSVGVELFRNQFTVNHLDELSLWFLLVPSGSLPAKLSWTRFLNRTAAPAGPPFQRFSGGGAPCRHCRWNARPKASP